MNLFSVLLFAIAFVIVYLVFYFIYDNKLKKEQYTKISELVLYTKLFNLDKKKMNYKSLLNGVAIINAFIIAFTAALLDFLPLRMEFKLIVAFFIILGLMFGLYYMYGRILKKKWGKKDGV